ncbi:MAG: DUF4935 domain-containing protein [Herpetosiphonaceae bacterium]|nr:DUF4935 domain-containing protein [Herpetosiphonaceae bacterium]
MNIYVETNFVLELVFQQEQSLSCEQILQLCESNQAQLIIPAYSLAEPHEKLIRQARSRRDLQHVLDTELRQLARTTTYKTRITSLQDITQLLIQSNEDDQQRFIQYRARILRTASIIPLTAAILVQATTYEAPYDLSPQDSLVYASVIAHLRESQPTSACFLNRNSKDFDNPDIVDELAQSACRMIARFDQGYNFIQAHA